MNCRICGRVLAEQDDPLSIDCGGDCWGCVGEAWLCNEMWSRASREAEHPPRLRALLDELRPTLAPWAATEPAGQLPVLAFRLRAADGQVLSFFSALTSFGTPLDITLASLKVEHLFPTDEATRDALAGVAGGAAS